MSEAAEFYRDLKRIRKEERKQKEQKMVDHARRKIEELGYKVSMSDEDQYFTFEFKGHTVTYWPYSGWASGRSIKDGRGLKNLINQIK